MASDFEIGRIIAVDTAQVTIELNADLKALTKTTYEGAHEIGRINSYIIIPVGARRLVGMVTRVFLTEEAQISGDRTMVTLPSARRLMKATLIGTIDGGSYTQGIAIFPVLDNPVNLVTTQDLDVIFDRRLGNVKNGEEEVNPENPGFCIYLGDSPIFEEFPIQINPDGFFGKHAAVIGSTGSGKSCTIATILQSILTRKKVKRTHFIILDTNGEYRRAFQKQRDESKWIDVGKAKCLYIPSDPLKQTERLIIPYWFMNSEDFVRLFRASPGVQRPVLLDALKTAREESESHLGWRSIRNDLIIDGNRILSACRGAEGRDARAIRQLCDEIIAVFQDPGSTGAVEQLEAQYAGVTGQVVTDAFSEIREIAREGIRNEGGNFESYAQIGAHKRRRIEAKVGPILGELCTQRPGVSLEGPIISADTPRYFGKMRFRNEHLERALARDDVGLARARDNCATMLMRIYRLLEDKRFEFLFGPVDGEWKEPLNSLASFVCDILGLHSPMMDLSPNEIIQKEALPFYDRQRSGKTNYNLVILDLSLLAAEVLENVTALIGRLILDFLQRLGEYGGEEARGSLPVVLVLEEAQNYIREPRFGEEESISRVVFERIAREGRKYGLGLVVASQRPSELSKTVLSQCSSFIVHRLQNPEDLRYFKEIVPGIYGPLLDQLPALAPQTALVLGECVRAPALVRIREARPVPRSRDPKFYRYWVAEKPEEPNVEEICGIWEGRPEKK
jgi:energy-coupling factor transporter ATP-binding protein EcfA2